MEELSLPLIVAKATTLKEYLEKKIKSKNQQKPTEKLAKLWCQIAAKGNKNKFEQRLGWNGLELDNIEFFLSEVDPKVYQNKPLPDWAKTLKQIIENSSEIVFGNHLPPSINPESPIPFEHLYYPFLQVAKYKLKALVGSQLDLLSDSAKKSLDEKLLKDISFICAGVLMKEFQEFRSSGNNLKDFFLTYITGSKSQEKYHLFINNLFKDNLVSLFTKYSVLGRLVATTVDFWVEAIAEFLTRLDRDWNDIENQFSQEKPLQQITNLEVGLSDNHNQGRSVIILTFDTGLKLVYKPQDISIDFAFNQFLDWCNNHSMMLPLKVIQFLNRSNYGWLEYVKYLPCQNQESIQNFYQRSGMLICLVYILEGSDFHFENFIASAEFPVLIDLECLLTHRIENINLNQLQNTTLALIHKEISESVLFTGLLPTDSIYINGELYSVSGLGVDDEQILSLLNFQNINTDAMDIGIDKANVNLTFKGKNLPVFNGVSFSSRDYLGEIVTGFKQMYNFLLSQQKVLLASDSPLMLMADKKVRYVFRSTNIYHKILLNSYSPEFLQSGLKHSIGLDILSRAFLAMENGQKMLPLLKIELEAMEQLDIPYFAANTSSNSLKSPTEEIIDDLFSKSSFQRMFEKIGNLNETKLTQQIAIIRGSFYSKCIKEPCHTSKDKLSFLETEKNNFLNSEQLLKQAIKIAQDLEQSAFRGDDGGVAWIGLNYKSFSQTFNFSAIDQSFYNGNCGIALFFAALAKVTHDSKWHNLTLSSLKCLQYMFNRADSNDEQKIRLVQNLGVSCTTGLASIIYAFVKISDFLQNPSLLEDANQMASLITLDLINADQKYNVMEGVAGIILSLVNLYEANSVNNISQSNLLQLLISCGEHIVNVKNQENSKYQPLTGFSQGLAGIAYALLKLFSVTQDTRFLEVATEAISYENSFFSNEANNWPDLRAEKPVFRVNWANGASGIALARLGCLSFLDTEQIRKDIDVALETTQKFCLGDSDNLCWGTFGCLEAILVASQKLNRPDLLEFCKPIVNHLILQAESKGNFSLFSNLPALIHNPSFFHGTSGIGYELLRFTDLDLLPSVLLWE